ncbi:MAG: SMP-30/gluconolactonase/LRE family protein [Gemmatimonadota bacterium]
MRAALRVTSFVALAALLSGCSGDADSVDATAEAPPEEDGAPAEAGRSGITLEGFENPESALHDPVADLYLVSNLAGDPTAKDGDGFVSRVSPDGEVVELRWIDGASDEVSLDAPKGMGLLGDTLLVADIDVVRLFDRGTGAPIDGWEVEGAHFLNDVAVADDGTIYVSDSGPGFGGEDADPGAPAIHAFSPDGSRRTLDTGDATGINGLAAVDSRLYGVTSGSGRVFLIEGGVLGDLPELPGLGLDGIVVVDEGLLVSDWDTEAVYLLRDNGSVSAVVRNVPSPADIGIDRTRERLLIPGLQTGQLLLAPLGD